MDEIEARRRIEEIMGRYHDTAWEHHNDVGMIHSPEDIEPVIEEIMVVVEEFAEASAARAVRDRDISAYEQS